MEDAVKQSDSVVVKTVLIQCGVEEAFGVFTQRMGAWWPATHHIGSTPFRDIIVEGHTGGRWYEINEDEAVCQWGTVLAWEPPHRVAVSWHLGPDWKFDPAMERASEVEAVFIAEGARTTRVELTHRHLERHGEGYRSVRDDVDKPAGWTAVLEAYRRLVEESHSREEGAQ